MSDKVNPGDVISAKAWNDLSRSARANQVLRGGENVRLQYTPHGVMINAKHTTGWNHPWRVVANQVSCFVNPGLINGIMPVMKQTGGLTGGSTEVKLTNRPAPILTFSSSQFDGEGNSWIALELTFDDKWQKITKAEVLQVPNITRMDAKHVDVPQFFYGFAGLPGQKSRYPLAKLRDLSKEGGFGIAVFQMAMFNLNHKSRQGEGKGSTRHFYWPV